MRGNESSLEENRREDMGIGVVVGGCSRGIGGAAESLSISRRFFCRASAPPKKLILYSKPGCCLCDGLKDKLSSALSLSPPNPLLDLQLQVRDITTNPEWEKAYQYEIPVLAKIRADGTEELLPRLSPRLGVEIIQKKIAAAFT